MKTIGLIGGTSWESSLEYYRLLNQGVKERLGGLHSARILMYSVDFGPMEEQMRAGDWDKVAATLSTAARSLEAGGAELLLLCSNTTHKAAPAVSEATGLPLVHIGDAVGREAGRLGLERLGLLGTRFVMEGDFLKGFLEQNYGLEILVPDQAERLAVNKIIFNELCRGVFSDESRDSMVGVMEDLARKGAGGVILGCTEIPMLVSPGDAPLPTLDTTALHAAAALDTALSD